MAEFLTNTDAVENLICLILVVGAVIFGIVAAIRGGR